MLQQTTIATPEAILQLGMAYCASKTLLSAVELGVFTELAQGELDCNTLSRRIGLHARGARDFLDTLVALRVLERRGNRYVNAEDANAFLDRNKPSYLGDILELANLRLYAHWGSLTDALRSGRPQNENSGEDAPYTEAYADPIRPENFLHTMTAVSLNTAEAVAAKFPWDEYCSFIDLGSAHGALAVSIAKAHAHLTGGGFDLMPAYSIFKKYTTAHGLQDRLRFYPGDFFKDALPSADVLVFGHVLHNWSLEQKKFLLKRAYDALTDEGALLVCEALIDDERKENLTGLLFSLTMLLETPGGFDFTGAECMAWMKETGFREVSVEHLVGPEYMVVGIK